MISNVNGAAGVYNATLNKVPDRDQQTAKVGSEKTQSADRVAQIKAAIESGTYKIDTEATAKKMAESLQG